MKCSNKILLGLGIIGILVLSPSCKSSNAVKGGAIGGSAGGVIGGLIGGKNNTATGIIIGSAIGGSAGAIIGDQMDKQAEELIRDLEGAKVERVAEGIKITFDSGLLFGFDQASLNTSSRTNLQNLATTLNKYEDTDVMIEGHTDSTGEESYNLTLSSERAYAVQDYLSDQGVVTKRMNSKGMGELLPLNSNETEIQREQNRRVEVAIYANKKMQRMAKRGQIGT
ncbi:MAG: OmpA family protein [Bacteroidota bacterium]